MLELSHFVCSKTVNMYEFKNITLSFFFSLMWAWHKHGIFLFGLHDKSLSLEKVLKYCDHNLVQLVIILP